jgi:hypothetical protein
MTMDGLQSTAKLSPAIKAWDFNQQTKLGTGRKDVWESQLGLEG